MNWLDLLLLGLFVFFFIAGFSRGLASQLIGLLGFFIAAVLAYCGSRKLAPLVASCLNPDHLMPVQETMEWLQVDLTMDWALHLVAGIVAFIVLFLVLLFLLRVLAGSLKVINRVPVIGTLNRFGGAALGLFRGAIFALLLIPLFSLLPMDCMAGTVGSSRFAAAADTYLPAITAAIKNLFLILH